MMSLRSTVATAGRFAALSAAVLASACTSSPFRKELSSEQFAVRAARDTAETRSIFVNSVDGLVARVNRPEDQGGGTIDVLAISGGGDFGAFGAGFLVGWGQVADASRRRPDFDVVTGVSTGALLAPFAYIGTDKAAADVEEFYRHPKKDWLRPRGLLFFLPSNPSFVEIPGLERDIRGTCNLEFIGQLAAQSERGKLLIVSATDLDLGRQKFWELGAEARKVKTSDDCDRIHRMLLASSAIPGAFPPIAIDDGMYVDGGVTANVFLPLDPRNPDGLLARWKEFYPDRPLPKVRYWVIVNNQMNHRPSTVQMRWPDVVSPSLAVAVRSATLAELRWLKAEAELVNASMGGRIEVRTVAIPDDWKPPVKGDFAPETMVSLSDLGRRLGADPNSWTLLVGPKAGVAR